MQERSHLYRSIQQSLTVVLVLMLGICQSRAQAVLVSEEDFSTGPHMFSSVPASAWQWGNTSFISNTAYMWAEVPGLNQDSVMLISPMYDLTQYAHVMVRFRHICKISPMDEVRFEYRLNAVGSAGMWKTVPLSAYRGTAADYLSGFSADSYSVWMVSDSLAEPNASWWAEECFDLSNEVSFDQAQFRFVVKKKEVLGTNISYGWLIDNFQVWASSLPIHHPVVQWVQPLLKDTVYSTGPHTIYAKITTDNGLATDTPYLVYTAIGNHVSITDSVRMVSYSGDSLWKADIPALREGTQVVYSVTGRDNTGNFTQAVSGYHIQHTNPVASYAEQLVIGDTAGAGKVWNVPVGDGEGAYQWCRMLYKSQELPKTACEITDMAFKISQDYRTQPLSGQTVYLAMVTDTVLSFASYENPLLKNADLVWTDTIAVMHSEDWLVMHLKQAFVYQPGKSLVVYFESRSPHSVDLKGMEFYEDSDCPYTMHMCAYLGDNASFPVAGQGMWSSRPSIRFTYNTLMYGNHSAALVRINSPVQDSVLAGNPVPVIITLRNTGSDLLDSVQINWSVNGVVRAPYIYKAKQPLPWDFTDVVQVGSYIPAMSAFDTVKIWLSMPNGQQDNVTSDDTLTSYVYGCRAPLSGIYKIGENQYFSTLTQAIAISNMCGASGDVKFLLSADTYSEPLDLSNLGSNYGPYGLTITTDSGRADFRLAQTVHINNVRNVSIKNIDFYISGATALRVNDAENLEIYHCGILSDTLTKRADVTGIRLEGYLKNVHLVGNTIQGGYAGIQLEGISSDIRAEVVIDSNSIENFYYSGIHLTYADAQVKANRLYSREFSNGSSLLMLYAYDVNGNIEENRIWQRNRSFVYSYGMYVYGMNVNNGGKKGNIVNNEIATYTNGAYSGIYITNAQCYILHNSVHVESAGSGRALYIADAAANNMEISGNDLVCTNGFPVYITNIAHISNLHIYGNNLYGACAGYAGGIIEHLTEWSAMMNDTASVSVPPCYADSCESLQWQSYKNAGCVFHYNAPADIQGKARGALTSIGAYGGVDVPETDAMLYAIAGIREGHVYALEDTVKAVLVNGGSGILDTAVLNWAVNGIQQGAVNWTGRLQLLERDTIILGTLQHGQGNLRVCAYLTSLGNHQEDANRCNDTVGGSYYECPSGGMSGVYVIGNGGDFESVSEAVENISMCGMSADVTLNILPGTYAGTVHLEGSKYYTNGYRLRITSSTQNADDVVLVAGGSVINMGLSEHIVLDYLTVDGGNTYGIFMNDSCRNIRISHCNVKCSDIAGVASSCPIYRPIAADWADSIAIVHNNIIGGYYGVYFYGSKQNSTYGTRIFFDSNHVVDQYYYAAYFSYCQLASCNGNRIECRKDKADNYWYGIRMNYCNIKLINNSISVNNASVNYAYGIYGTYINTHDNVLKDSALIANNVIDFHPCGTYGTAVYLNNFNGEILHNSLHKISSQGGNYGIYVFGGSEILRIKNNNIDGNWVYCIYLGRQFNMVTDDIDANNMRSGNGSVVGYANGGSRTLITWKNIVLSDKHAVLTRPHYLREHYLYLSDSVNMGAPVIAQMPLDKDGRSRGNYTCMGAYHYCVHACDANLKSFVQLDSEYAANTVVPVKVVLHNSGSSTLHNVIIRWRINDMEQTPYYWQGSLFYNGLDTVTLGSVNILRGEYRISAYTAMPNNMADIQTVNDTVEQSLMTCSGALDGVYSIGKGKDFDDISIAWKTLSRCGVKGNVTLLLYEDADMENFSFSAVSGTSPSCRIEIESAYPQYVTLYSQSSPAVLLQDACYISFRHLNIGNAEQGVVIKFAGVCKYITIDSCCIYGKPYSVNKEDNTIEADFASGNSNSLQNVIISHNYIKGGYANIYFSYAAGVGSNMKHDSGNEIVNNYMTDAYCYGLYSYYYSYYRKVSGNTVVSRNNAGQYYGITMYYFNTCEQLNANKIHIRADGNAYGIYPYGYHNYSSSYGANESDRITNNEVIIHSAYGDAYGIYIDNNTNADICHNSVYTQGNNSYALYKSMTEPGYTCTVKNNNLAAKKNHESDPSCHAYAMSVLIPEYATATHGCTDYNNYYTYGSEELAYIGLSCAGLQDMKIYQDVHSCSVDPCFFSEDSCLQMPACVQASCPVSDSVRLDINGMVRSGVTRMGAYDYPPDTLNMALLKIVVPAASIGVSMHPVLHYVNVGSDSIAYFTCDVWYNGVLCATSHVVNCKVPFLCQGVDTLPSLLPVAGKNSIQVYITSVNGTGGDVMQNNDTVNMSFYTCTRPMGGNYTIGAAGADYANIGEFAAALRACSADTDIVLDMQNGIYDEMIDFRTWNTYLGNHHLTIQSVSRDSSQVIIGTHDGAVILCNNSNIEFRYITLQADIGAAVQINETCANIVFYHCQIVHADTSPVISYGIYKPIGGIVNNMSVIACMIKGARYGLYLYGGVSNSRMGSDIRIDSNIFLNQRTCAVYVFYASSVSVSYNTLMNNLQDSIYQWSGVYANSADGPVVGNSVCQQNGKINNVTGFDLNYYGYYRTSDMQLVANNTISLCGAENVCGMHSDFSRNKICHNTIKVGRDDKAVALKITNHVWIEVKNNILDAGKGCPIWLSAPVFSDYNNYYSTACIGYLSIVHTSMRQWQQSVNGDQHSVHIPPQYLDTLWLELDTNEEYVCGLLPDVSHDKKGQLRNAYTCMGAYEGRTPSVAAHILEWVDFPEYVVENQSVPVNLCIVNTGIADISGISIGWSVNGIVQTPYIWTANVPLGSHQADTVSVGVFTITGSGNIEVNVWIDSVNSMSYVHKGNDTLKVKTEVCPLACFVEPLVWDTVYGLSFPVHVRIMEGTGALINMPFLHVETYVNDKSVWQEDIPMTQEKEYEWFAIIPQQCYGSKVIFSLLVTDTVNNHVMLQDSTCLQYSRGVGDVQAGNGKLANQTLPFNTCYNYGWSRSVYSAWELDKESKGGVISKIALQYVGGGSVSRNNVNLYMLAVDDTVEVTSNYRHPVVNDGATLVWSGNIPFNTGGWYEINLYTWFTLPAGKHLRVYWEDNTGHYNCTYYCYNHATEVPRSARGYSDESFAASQSDNLSLLCYRPNMRFTIGYAFEAYMQADLAITEILSPNNDAMLCSPDSSSVNIVLSNLSERAYSYNTDSVIIHAEVLSPVTMHHSVRIDTGMLGAGKSDTIELWSAMPTAMQGRYDIKVWLEQTDQIPYDDTLCTSYWSSRKTLPIDENFANGLPVFLYNVNNNTNQNWHVLYDSNSTATVYPVTGNAMLTFNGDRGAMSQLYSQQLDFSNTVHPVLDFWYYHDTAADAKDYTDVRLTTDGGENFVTLFHLQKNNGQDMGWTYYNYALDSFVNQTCVILVLEAMRKSSAEYDGSQYIDCLRLLSAQDMAVIAVQTSPVSVCDYSDKQLQVVLSALTGQAVDFSRTPTALYVDISGADTGMYYIPLNQGAVPAMGYDTIVVDSHYNFVSGVYYVTVWLASPIDDNGANDTLSSVLDESARMDVHAWKITDENNNENCLGVGTEVNQHITLVNNGNIDMENIVLTMNMYDVGGELLHSYYDTLPGVIKRNDTLEHTFTQAYIVPNSEMYIIEVKAVSMCDTALDFSDIIVECVNLSDIEVAEILSPIQGQIQGSLQKAKVRVYNHSAYQDAKGVVLHLELRDTVGTTMVHYVETMNDISADTYTDFEFPQAVTIPKMPQYAVLSYVDNRDANASNDTVYMLLTANVHVKEMQDNSFCVRQNVPNPAQRSTTITYIVSSASEIRFSLAGVEGQELYSQNICAVAGENILTLDLMNYASGVYFYSFEYQGKRITKKLVIEK
ncbi:MAG: T9SS type A sorting domain-containing protein [Bacteroidales bacterium]|nr:T9SS type A sorting domain-containing protein [Bacteroidales bacterium]